MTDVDPTIAESREHATASAIADVQAALNAAAHAQAEASHGTGAAASGAAVGHGVIRLLGPSQDPSAERPQAPPQPGAAARAEAPDGDVAPTTRDPAAAAASATAIGHGEVRLLAQSPRSSADHAVSAPEPAPAAAAGPIGHGSIRLRGQPTPAEPGPDAEPQAAQDPLQAATDAAREEILAALALSR